MYIRNELHSMMQGRKGQSLAIRVNKNEVSFAQAASVEAAHGFGVSHEKIHSVSKTTHTVLNPTLVQSLATLHMLYI
jgi:hypothetical protein